MQWGLYVGSVLLVGILISAAYRHHFGASAILVASAFGAGGFVFGTVAAYFSGRMKPY